MKTLKIIISLILSCSIMISCVSKRKYNEAVSGSKNWEEKYNALQANYGKLESEKQQLAENSEEELKNKQAALDEEERKMRDMKAMVDAQRNAIENLKKEVCSALKCFTPDELTIEIRDGKLYVSMSDKLLFPSGSDQVNARGKEAITMLAAVLNHSDLEIMVEGHTDPVPINTSRNKDNWDLSAHRATSVTRIFTENGIAEERIIAAGRAEFHPLAENTTAEGRQTNRRTEIVLAPKLDKLWKLTEEATTSSTDGSKN